MSCDRAQNRAGVAAGASGGITRMQSKLVSTSAAMANRVLSTIDRQGIAARIVRSGGVQAARKVSKGLTVTTAAAGVGAAAGASGGTAVAALYGGLVAARVATGYRSRRIEKADRNRGPVDKVQLSEGYATKNLLEDEKNQVEIYGRKEDPSGSTTFRLPDGQGWVSSYQEAGGQIVSALKSSSLGGNEYYFKGNLSNKDAVGIATGEVQPQKVSGYVGMVSGTEKLSPAWAGIKRGLIGQSTKG